LLWIAKRFHITLDLLKLLRQRIDLLDLVVIIISTASRYPRSAESRRARPKWISHDPLRAEERREKWQCDD
jgi:hypothetical protein